jgi:hypothetical protein
VRVEGEKARSAERGGTKRDLKNGFRMLGEFEYHGLNYDMILEIV